MDDSAVPPIPPKGWRDDALSIYLDACRRNQYATFANKRAAVGDLIKIDALFRRLLVDMRNPKPEFPAFFVLRAHSAFLSSVAAIMSGQTFEAHGQLRLCLEHASYGHYIGDKEERWLLWMGRHDSEKGKKAVRDEFRPSTSAQRI